MPRPDVTMGAAVRAAFLADERTLRLAVVGADGWPDVVPLWFVHHPDPRGDLWIWNLTRARRTPDLEAGARCGVAVDGGEAYGELRGLTARATPTRVPDDDVPLEVRRAYSRKYFAHDEPLPPAHHHAWFALALSDERSWDFRRLGG
ncbi:MAG: pyridoxamine 5'-phosphate oxidase family protein [Nitriliruptoraceae bacterium]